MTRLAAGTVIGAGLLLALAATLPPPPSPTAAAGASVTVRLPPTVQTVVLTLLGLSSILLLLVWQRARRRLEDGMLDAPARAPRSPWAALLSLVPLLTLLAAIWYLVHHRPAGDDGHPIERAITAIAGLLDLLARARKPPTAVPLLDAAVATALVLAVLAIFVILLLLVVGARSPWWTARAGAGALVVAQRPRPQPADPRAERDPRLAVIRAWENFEHALERAHAPRAPWQTPAQFMRTTLARVPLPAAPVQRLTALFEVARFSDRPTPGDAAVAACECLDAITTALDEGRR